MKDFDLKKYLIEGKLTEESVKRRVSDDLEAYYDKNDHFGMMNNYSPVTIFFRINGDEGDKNEVLRAKEHLDNYIKNNNLDITTSIENHGNKIEPLYVVRARRLK
jgi:hypothetical protein